MKKRRKAAKKAVTTERSLFFKPAILTSALVIILAIAGISAFAGNALLHESAINHGIEQFNPQKEEQQLTTDVESKHQEMMPIEAKAATNRKEADQLIAQGVESNSDFVYDPWGRLARINEPDGSVRQFLYHEDKICEERDGTGAVTKKFFEWGQINGSTKYTYNRDHLGSVRELVDTSGNVVASYGYDSFGQVTKLSGTGADSDFLYAGYFYHRPSKLYITAHRVYSPKLARWLTRDPVDEPTFAMIPDQPETVGFLTAYTAAGAPPNPNLSLVASASNDPMVRSHLAKQTFGGATTGPQNNQNLYTYVNNNPLSYSDPSGLAASCPATNNNDLQACYSKCISVCRAIHGTGPGFSRCLTACFKLCRGD